MNLIKDCILSMIDGQPQQNNSTSILPKEEEQPVIQNNKKKDDKEEEHQSIPHWTSLLGDDQTYQELLKQQREKDQEK